MNKTFKRHDFVIKDLVISVGGGRHGGTWMPGPDGKTPPSPISPVASVLANMDLINTVRATMREAIESGKGLESIGKAFVKGSSEGNPAIQSAIHDIGTAVVASAAFASGGSVGLPDPTCNGTSLETIPTSITPIIHVGRRVHQVSELPRLQKQLELTTKFVDKAAAERFPNGNEVEGLRENLELALKELG